VVRRVSLSEVVTTSCSSVLHAPREWDDRLLGGGKQSHLFRSVPPAGTLLGRL
jgi:hypothetical protein